MQRGRGLATGDRAPSWLSICIMTEFIVAFDACIRFVAFRERTSSFARVFALLTSPRFTAALTDALTFISSRWIPAPAHAREFVGRPATQCSLRCSRQAHLGSVDRPPVVRAAAAASTSSPAPWDRAPCRTALPAWGWGFERSGLRGIDTRVGVSVSVLTRDTF
eukprot:4264347-Prymnesium_polylepis.2